LYLKNTVPTPALHIPAPGSELAIQAENVSMHYPGSQKGALLPALAGISLAIAAGEFISLVGPSGCGKTTLLRLLADLLQPAAGTILLNCRPARQARLNREYGFVPQSPALQGWRTVLENVALPLELMKVSRAVREERAGELLGLVGLAGFRQSYPAQLSGGMQQRAAIARAIALKPSILLMDEPFGALDEITREHLNGELLNIWRETRTTIVFVTHSISEAVFLSNRVVVMSPRPGRISGLIQVDLPQPRRNETREMPRYFELIREVRETLRASA
jgi:NitT/TauT family transport system ATP-binding protein